VSGGHPVRFGNASMARDLDRPRAWMLDVDGVPQSYVDLDDPTYLDFEYQRGVAHLLDCLAAPGVPLTVAHLGGGACTLPRYVTATRPGSAQVVFEPDGPLLDLVRERLGPVEGAEVRVADGRAGLASLPEGWADVVLVDAFVGSTVPGHLLTAESVAAAARVLRRPGFGALPIDWEGAVHADEVRRADQGSGDPVGHRAP
jgi:spermidine synthase